MSLINERLKQLNIVLPPAPAPAANYIPYVKSDKLIFVSGQIPLLNGELITGKVAKNIEMMVIDGKTGKKADFGSGEIIIESFKKNTIEKNILNGNDNFVTTKNNILKFY